MKKLSCFLDVDVVAGLVLDSEILFFVVSFWMVDFLGGGKVGWFCDFETGGGDFFKKFFAVMDSMDGEICSSSIRGTHCHIF